MRMLQIRRNPAPILALALLAAPAVAEEQLPPPTRDPLTPTLDRYSMTPAQSGFLRLDKQSGVVSYCTVENGLAACRLGADERAALETEIARLRRENAELKAARGPAPGPSSSTLPREEEFERALSFAERFFRRMMRVLKDEAPGDKS